MQVRVWSNLPSGSFLTDRPTTVSMICAMLAYHAQLPLLSICFVISVIRILPTVSMICAMLAYHAQLPLLSICFVISVIRISPTVSMICAMLAYHAQLPLLSSLLCNFCHCDFTNCKHDMCYVSISCTVAAVEQFAYNSCNCDFTPPPTPRQGWLDQGFSVIFPDRAGHEGSKTVQR